MKVVHAVCAVCGSEFKKPTKEYNRILRSGRTEFYCSLKCSQGRGKDFPKKVTVPREVREVPYRFIKQIRKFVDRTGIPSNLTQTDIKEAFTGKCAYSGLVLNLNDECHSPYRASLDRIDSFRGYVKGNIQFVCYSLNLAKSNFSDADFKDFLADLGAAPNASTIEGGDIDFDAKQRLKRKLLR